MYGVPKVNALCPDGDPVCDLLIAVMNAILDAPLLGYEFQEIIAPAAYWRDVTHNYAEWREKNIFLADINNERVIVKESYKVSRPSGLFQWLPSQIGKLDEYQLFFARVLDN